MPKKHHSKGDSSSTSYDMNEMIMLEDSAHGTLCSIHQRINSTEHFPCSEHQMLHLCPASKSPSICSHVPLKSQKKSSSGGKKKRSASSPGKRRQAYTSVVPQGHQPGSSPKISTIMTFKNGSPSSMSVKSKSCIYLDNLEPLEGNTNTDEMVTELRHEIERVKDQLKCFSLCALSRQKLSTLSTRPSSREQTESESTKFISKLKAENRKLKRDLETKKRLLESFKASIEKAKDILNDYEKKVSLLHQQAIKSSQLMRLSKEKFCKCLRDKDEKIKCLSENNKGLTKTIHEKNAEAKEVSKKTERLQELVKESAEQCSVLCDKNKTYCQMIENLRAQLNDSGMAADEYKENLKQLEEKVSFLNCTCKKMAGENKRQKEECEEKLKEYELRDKQLMEQNSQLAGQLEEMAKTKSELESLQEKYKKIKDNMKEYEQYASKCKTLEEQCSRQLDTMLQNEKLYQKEQDEMRKLIEELTMVVKQNKITLLQMSDINKHQEIVIQSQSDALMIKEERLKLVETESEKLRKKSAILEQEVEDMRRLALQPCKKEECLSRDKELELVRNALTMEKDNHYVKQKIIQDQSQTICSLQCQIKEKIKELSKAQTDTATLEMEINKVNGDLMRKHEDLNKELHEKDVLLEKLRALECQRTQLADEMCELECSLNKYITTVSQTEVEREKLTELKEQIEKQNREWEHQKDILAKEKVMAVKAANFATQKLVETVADFQKQVDAQRKVQLMLTKMLHSKDEELRRVNSKMSFISQLTKTIELPTKELYRNKQPGCCASDPTTTNSFYSLKSNSSPKCKCSNKKCPYVEIQEVLDMLNSCICEKENEMGDVKY